VKELLFTHDHSLVPAETLHALEKQLQPEIERMRTVASSGSYTDERSSINLVADEALQQRVKAAVRKVDLVVVVGIGGSNLGTLAIHEALHGKNHNGLRAPSIYFADTVDADAMADMVVFIERYLERKMHVLLVVISKSGATTETIANFEVLYSLLQKHVEHPHKHVVAITDDGSPFHKLAEQQDFTVLTMPKQVGGRYSVFSAVGLYPLALLGVDTHSLLAGAKHMREKCLAEKNNPAATLAAIQYYHETHGRNIYDTFLFSTDLESIGKWYRQLLGESIGKEHNRAGKQVFVGITPTVSVGSTDLHSVGQLYLGGPQDKLTTFVTVSRTKTLSLPQMPAYEPLVPHIQEKELRHLMHAIEQGVQAAYMDKARPFCHFTLPEKSPYVIGQFLQLHMMATMYLGALMDVNPFDQPNVESYKKETKRILSS
jgi:glucose-6-phosphate isomerase